MSIVTRRLSTPSAAAKLDGTAAPAEALAEISRLTARQERFVEHYALCGNATEAARLAGYSARTARQIATENLSKPAVVAAIGRRQAGFAQELRITKDEVITGILGAIELAREQQDAGAMIGGLTQIAKLCGFYAPEIRRLELTADGARLQDKFRAMSDEELLAFAAG